MFHDPQMKKNTMQSRRGNADLSLFPKKPNKDGNYHHATQQSNLVTRVATTINMFRRFRKKLGQWHQRLAQYLGRRQTLIWIKAKHMLVRRPRQKSRSAFDFKSSELSHFSAFGPVYQIRSDHLKPNPKVLQLEMRDVRTWESWWHCRWFSVSSQTHAGWRILISACPPLNKQTTS